MSGEKGPQLGTPPPSAEAVKTAPEGQTAAPAEAVKAPEAPTEADQLKAKQEAEKAELAAKHEAGKAELKSGGAEKKSALLEDVVGTAVEAATKAGEPPVDAATKAKIEESLKRNTGEDGEIAEGFWADLAELGAGLAEIFKDLFDGIGKKKKEDAKKDEEAEREAVESKDFGELLDPKARVFSFPKLVNNKEVNPRVTSRKGHRERPTEGASTDHKGDDIGVPTGTPIVYTGEEPARVRLVTTQTDRETGKIKGGGHYVSLLLPDGSEAFFMHLRELPPLKEGDLVEAGTLIAYSGNSGTSTGPHLHFEVRQNKVAVAPEPWLAERFQA